MITLRSGTPVSWRRITFALVLVFGSVTLLELWFEPYFAARFMGMENAMEVVPIPLFDSTVGSTSPTSRIKRKGVSFEVPWSETERSKFAPNARTLTFTNGLGIYISDPLLQMKNVEIVRGLRGIRAAAIRLELGREALGSEFAFVSAAMAATRSDAKWWRSPIYNSKVELLLTEKMNVVSSPFDRRTPIYGVNFRNVRGFQMGDPRGTQDDVKLILFDELDHQYRIDLIHARMKINQSEINALVTSLRLEPENP